MGTTARWRNVRRQGRLNRDPFFFGEIPMSRSSNGKDVCPLRQKMLVRNQHGTPLYKAWENMHARCKPGHAYAHCYSGRGIAICKRWDTFANFAADMGSHPGTGQSLDRKNNDKGYYKRNCQWATPTMQGRNRRTTKLTDVLAAKIRKSTAPTGVLAKQFMVSKALICNIRHGRRWL